VTVVEREPDTSLSRSEKLRLELRALPNETLSLDEIRRRNLLPHGVTATRIDKVGFRQFQSMPESWQEDPIFPFGNVFAIGWYRVPRTLTDDHFDIAPGKETFEAATHAAACLIRSTPSCSGMATILRRQCEFVPLKMVLPGDEIQSVVWIEDINDEGANKFTGSAYGHVMINGVLVMTIDFHFLLTSWEDFTRLRQIALAERPRNERKNQHRIVY
jgi:hypothetical protein